MTTRLSLLGLACSLVACFEPNAVVLDTDEGTTGGGSDPTVGDTEGSTVPSTSIDPSATTTPTTTLPTTTDPSTTDATTSPETTDPTTSPETTDPTTSPETTDPSTDDTGSTSGEESSSTGDPDGDADDDGVLDGDDNCVDVENPDQSDLDSDDVGDWCDDEIIDNGEILYIPAGQAHTIDYGVCYTGEVRVYGTLRIFPNSAGGVGGVILIADGPVWIAEGGTVDGNAAGYLGGSPSATANVGGFQGDGFTEGCGGGPGSGVGQGGSGGGYGGAGGSIPDTDWSTDNPCDLCSEATISHCEGAAGGVSGTLDGADVELGSGGGAGGNSSGCTSSGGRGGNGGGGLILISHDSLRIDGSIQLDGEEPPTDAGACGYRPGGGGGAGGGMFLGAPTIIGEASASLTARGGNGGQALGDVASGTWGWAGGGGGGGRIKLFGDSTGFDGSTNVSGGLGGVAPADMFSFAGEPGSDGEVGSDNVIPADYEGFCP